ncbi:type II toxin-antitoxin system VapC family toxin [Leadbettera azotonutricia]|uniref:PilT protein domain protein n=1 Tax=Leadbettera azotonutricia (strain ATCC BAA-888 / DSM 13862 / ZAS-9) TaxID=545695 RepID=F5YCD6_LEAAZ|nr:type II toxin-antitoxin system VapC family toxin [Leadbettera azotonutricia]AEF83336.1 PilT protein domain protein [Leadbettera azotonutricia ZAS-9]
MAKARFTPDSSILISHINKALDLSFLDAQGESDQYASIIASIEVLSKPNMLQEEQKEVEDFLARFVEIPITDPIKYETIAIRRSTKLKLPDAVIAATAVILNATLLSNDPHLLNLRWPGLTVKSII